MEYDIFISYSRKDLNKARNLKADIEKKTNAKCWMDLDKIPGGDEFEDVIIKAISNSKMVLFVMSKHSQKSENTKNEIRFAKNKEKRIVPVNIDDCKLEDWFSYKFDGKDIIYINKKEQREKLFENIKLWFGSLPGTKQTLKHRKGWLYVVVILALLALLSIGGVVLSNLTKENTTEIRSFKPVAVDLGLPSGTFWCDRNIGATEKDAKGDFYSWGDTVKRKSFHQNEYDQGCKPSSSMTSIAGSKYDIASKTMGSRWKVPSKAQFQELIDECTWVWSKNPRGYYVTGKNGNQIFLPAAGWSCGNVPEYTEFGFYWTSDGVKNDQGKALCVRFPVDHKAKIDKGYTYYGRKIRPVCRVK
ncbi:MAG: toll/interleukin-1 receptor domain-containing protein [Muribaculaceae bacterium]|nr:toll/interleukin-1 receptor domain-containing protein [Muribaculaceae bacterium]